MKAFALITLALFSVIPLTLRGQSAEDGMSLRVMVDQIPEQGAPTHIMLYDANTDFLNTRSEPLASGLIPAGNSRGTVDFEGLEANTYYAIAVFCDFNGNEVLDRTAAGRPTESYAFSQLGRFTGVPSFSDAAFQLAPGTSAILLSISQVKNKARTARLDRNSDRDARPLRKDDSKPIAGR